MIVIDDQQEIVFDVVIKLIGQHDQDGLCILLDGFQTAKLLAGGFADNGKAVCQGSNQVCQETLRIAVERVEREPADGHLAAVCEVDQQGRLAIARRCRQEQKLVVQQRLKALQQTGTRK